MPRKPRIPTLRTALPVFGDSPLKKVLEAAKPRPLASDSPSEKGKYAVRFADEMARSIAVDLQPKMHGIRATTKREAASAKGYKQLDINFSTLSLGLALGVSLKSVHIRETDGRYTHNMKRNEEELRVEASGYHKRQPFAVMIGVLFLPFDSCTDAKLASNPSSFGSWVRHLRPYGIRLQPTDDIETFERLYIALYNPDGSELGFFDVRSAPPKNTRPSQNGPAFDSDLRALPKRLLTYAEFLSEIHRAYANRNPTDFEWADGTREPL